MNRRWLGLVAAGMAIALGVALLSPLASSEPDGLETVAEEEGFEDEAQDPGYTIIPDYQFPGINDERVATIVAAISGVLIVAGLMFGAGLLLRGRGRESASTRERADGAAG